MMIFTLCLKDSHATVISITENEYRFAAQFCKDLESLESRYLMND